MKRLALLALPLFSAFCAMGEVSKPTAFINVNVVPMTSSGILRNQTVIVSGDRITAIGDQKATPVPNDATRIEGRGKFLMPGLAEMHGHIPPSNAPRELIENVLFLYLANGITTVRGMLGHPGQLELRAQVASGALDSPTLYLAGPSFNGQSVNSPEEAVAKVRQQKTEGWDLLKVHPGLTRPEYDAMARTAREVGIRFGGHVPEPVGIEHAIDMGQETFDHLDGYLEYVRTATGTVDDAKLAAIIAKTKKANAWVVPTMALWEVLFGSIRLSELRKYEELRYAPPEEIEQWTRAYIQRKRNPEFSEIEAKRMILNRMKILAAMNRAGVRILMGTDAPQQFSVPGFSLHRELQRMSSAGMSPYQILISGSRNVGEYFNSSDKFGTVTKGSRADLVLVDANPLVNIASVSKISGVMARGRWYSRKQIDEKLKEIARSARE